MMDDITDVQVVISMHIFLLYNTWKAPILKIIPPNLGTNCKAFEEERVQTINQNAYLRQFL